MTKLFIILLFLSLVGCKTTSRTTFKSHSINDTIIYEKSEVIQLPANYTYTSKTPCKNDSLIISDQSLEIGRLKLEIINLNGELVITVKKDSVVETSEKEISKHSEKLVETVTETIIVYRTHKFWWYLLGIVVFYVAYRVARIYIPIIRFLPY